MIVARGRALMRGWGASMQGEVTRHEGESVSRVSSEARRAGGAGEGRLDLGLSSLGPWRVAPCGRVDK